MLLAAYVCCSSATLMTYSAGITRWMQQEEPTPSAHECLKPLEAGSLLIGEGEKRSWFGHHYEGYVSVCYLGAVGRSNVGGTQFQCGALISHFALCSLSIDGKPTNA